MTLDEFLASVAEGDQPPASLPEALQALWWAEKGEWEKAHVAAQEIPTKVGSWIHANLHRQEGDLGNARYWYSRAQKAESKATVKIERREIIRSLL